MTDTLYTQSPATEKQITFLIKLLAERIEDPADALAAITWVQEHKLSKATASAKISEYLSKPKVREAFSSTTELDEGIYRHEDAIYKVYRTREDHLAVKQLIEGAFEYMGKRPLKFLRDEHRMTLEEAKEYGRITSICCQCGRKLTDETSIAEGIGPVCAGKI
jgi:hypothetical protein